MTVIDFDGRRIAPFILRALEIYIEDPPDSHYQAGYLGALLDVVTEGLGRDKTDARIETAQRILDRWHAQQSS